MLHHPTRAFLCSLLWSAFAMAASAEIPFETLEKGTSSGFEEELYRVYRTPEEFAALWGTHASNRYPAPSVPNVDFGTSMVAAVFSGQRMTGGYGVEVKSVNRNDAGAVTVNYETSSPPPGAMTTQALTEPFHMIRLEKSDGEVVFEGSVKPQAAPSPPATAFIIGFESGADKDAVAVLVEAHPAHSSTQHLTNFLVVRFDSSQTSKEDFMQFLQDLEGVKYVEEDQVF